MAYEFFLGVDAADDARGAVALVEKTTADDLPRYTLRAAETFADGRSPQQKAERVQSLIASEPYTAHTSLVVNRTGKPGAKMLDLLIEEGLTPVAVTLTGGDGVGQADTGIAGTGRKGGDRDGINISTHALFGALREVYQSGQLNVADLDLPETSEMLDALHNEDEAAGESIIDGHPLVRAIALACWYGEQRGARNDEEPLDDEAPRTLPGQPKPAVNP